VSTIIFLCILTLISEWNKTNFEVKFKSDNNKLAWGWKKIVFMGEARNFKQ